jgi:hypothetical protein
MEQVRMKQEFNVDHQVAQDSGLATSQPSFSKYTPPRLSLNTAYYSRQQYPQSTTALPTPSSSDCSGLSPHGQSNIKPSDASVATTVVAVSPYGNEMEETMFGVQNPAHYSAPLPDSTINVSSQWHQEYSQAFDTKSSCSGHDYRSSAVIMDYSDGSIWPQQDGHACQHSDGHSAQPSAIPIAHKTSTPNYEIGSYGSYGSPSESAASASSTSSDGFGTSFLDNNYVTNRYQLSHTANTFVNKPNSGLVISGCTTVDDNSDVQGYHAQDNHLHQPHALQLHHTVPFFQCLPSRQYFFGATLELDDGTPVADMRDGYWRPLQRPIASMQCSREKVDKDEILLDCRARGMPYKEIKRAYSLTEAVSTLRGRHRTLTKDKKDRVRKPEWTPEDVSDGILNNYFQAD